MVNKKLIVFVLNYLQFGGQLFAIDAN